MDPSLGSETTQVIDFNEARRQALWVVAGQALVALLSAGLCLTFWGRRAAESALVGGAIGALATYAQVRIGLRSANGRTARQVVQSFYRGSAMKLVVAVLLFVLALRAHRFLPAPLFVTYVVTFLVYWLALARVLTPKLGAALRSSE